MIGLAALVALALAACGGTVPAAEDPGSGETEREAPPYATGEHDVLVDITEGPGFTPVELAVDRRPTFRLYGDGTVFVTPEGTRWTGGFPVLDTYRLNEAGIEAVLTAAERAGLLAPPPDYGQPAVTDLGTTTVTIDLAGVRFEHAAYALGFEDGVGLEAEQRDAREQLSGFVSHVTGLAETQPDLLAAPPTAYEPQALDVYAWELQGDAAGPPLEWPVEPPLTEFPHGNELGGGCRTLGGGDAAAIRDALAGGGPFTAWSSGGKLWSLGFDLVLPGEQGCTRTSDEPPAGETAALARCEEPANAPEGPTEAEIEAFQGEALGVVQAVERYGRSHPDAYAGVWIDWAFGGVTAAFTSGVVAHGAALAELAAGNVPVRAVEARYTERELRELQQRISEEARSVSDAWGVDLIRNRVTVSMPVVDEAALEFLADRYPVDAICVSGPSPEELVPEGPQPESGRGWRLLADAPGVGTTWDTSVAIDQDGYETLWRTLELPGSPPAVDFDREIVLHFGPAVSGSCPDIRLDGVQIEGDLVYAEIVRPGVQPSVCTADANPHTYLVAVERAILPSTPFRVQLDPEACPGCEGRTDITLVEAL